MYPDTFLQWAGVMAFLLGVLILLGVLVLWITERMQDRHRHDDDDGKEE